MKQSNQIKNQHLLSRAGFGVCIADIPHLGKNPEKVFKRLLKASQEPIKEIKVQNPFVASNTAEIVAMDTTISKEDLKEQNAERRRAVNKQSAEDIKQISIDWMNEMATSQARLREKMALFWHGHFACISGNSMYQEQLLKVIRTHALGDFSTLLTAVSKSAAMLNFLNNQENKKKHPNENFAREVMELFTLGRGNYTEKDVKEVARAFTGWHHEQDGSFKFNEKTHDDGEKTFLGQQGKFNGDDALRIILEQPQAARFIAQKIYKYLVNEQIDEQQLNELTAQFIKSNLNIADLLTHIFTSDWFYEERNIGVIIKSPVLYMAGIRTFLPMTLKNETVQILIERLLGQWLFNPPNVAGWPGGKAWIDGSSLMLRLKIPLLIKNDENIDLKPKENDDIQMGRKESFETGAQQKKKKAGAPYQIIASVDWTKLTKALDVKDKQAAWTALASLLIQSPARQFNEDTIKLEMENEDLVQFTKRVTIQMMSTPEYQLC